MKAVHLGSTIGIKKVFEVNELIEAICENFELDYHLLIEEEVKGREIEFSVIGKGPYQVFSPGEICPNGGIYDYEKKYINQDARVIVQADLTVEQIDEGKKIALMAYQAIGGDGMARVDLFFDQNQNFIVNEINPIPGMTKNSLFPKMCEAGGCIPRRLFNLLVQKALHRRIQGARLY